jgi:hypothetical protein
MCRSRVKKKRVDFSICVKKERRMRCCGNGATQKKRTDRNVNYIITCESKAVSARGAPKQCAGKCSRSVPEPSSTGCRGGARWWYSPGDNRVLEGTRDCGIRGAAASTRGCTTTPSHHSSPLSTPTTLPSTVAPRSWLAASRRVDYIFGARLSTPCCATNESKSERTRAFTTRRCSPFEQVSSTPENSFR